MEDDHEDKDDPDHENVRGAVVESFLLLLLFLHFLFFLILILSNRRRKISLPNQPLNFVFVEAYAPPADDDDDAFADTGVVVGRHLPSLFGN